VRAAQFGSGSGDTCRQRKTRPIAAIQIKAIPGKWDTPREESELRRRHFVARPSLHSLRLNCEHLMQAHRLGDHPTSTQLLKSSNDLGWSTLFAELRSHSRYEGPGAAASADAKIGIVVRGSDEGLATCKVAENLASSSRCCVSIGSRISSVSACACASRAVGCLSLFHFARAGQFDRPYFCIAPQAA
jgi:hypothetical protein